MLAGAESSLARAPLRRCTKLLREPNDAASLAMTVDEIAVLWVWRCSDVVRVRMDSERIAVARSACAVNVKERDRKRSGNVEELGEAWESSEMGE